MTVRAQPTLGVFGGSFDPPHLGHCLLVSWLLARADVDRVLVAPVHTHAWAKRKQAPFLQRLAWTQAAMRSHGETVVVSSIERDLAAEAPDQPSYTIRLLDAVAQRYPGFRVRLVLGSDLTTPEATQKWHRWPEIEARYAPIVVPRMGFSDPNTCALPKVSSTEVRAALACGDWDAVRERVPAAVADLLHVRPRGSVWVVGSGHVATHVRPWLAARGFEVEQLSARAVAGGEATFPRQPPAGVWVLAADPAIEAVARGLHRAAVLPAGVPVFHGAGARSGRDLLGQLAHLHPVGSLHPICALRRERPWPSLLHAATFGIEGCPKARAFLAELVAPQPTIDLQPLTARQRLQYHAACALAANHISVLEGLATSVLANHGTDPVVVTAALRVLMRSALDNLQALGIPDGVTGPMSRGDSAAISAHVDALEGDPKRAYTQLSRLLGRMLGRNASESKAE